MDRKPGEGGKIRNYSIRIPEELMEKVRYANSYWGRSMNMQILRILQKYIKNFEKEHGSID